MKNIKLIIGTSALVAVMTVGFAASAFAYQGDPSQQGPNYTPERHEAMEQAFETKNYNAWKDLMSGKGRVSQVINEGNFAKFAEAHELAESGDVAGAKAIRTELGLGNGGGNHGAKGKGMNKAGVRGQNAGGNFVDADGNGACDKL